MEVRIMVDKRNKSAGIKYLDLKFEIMRKGYTLQEFSGIIGIANSTLSRYIKGGLRIPTKRKQVISAILHIPQNKIFGINGNKKNK